MASKGKRLKSAYENIDREAFYGVSEAVRVIKESASTKFDETVEIAINLGIDPRHADQMVRGVIALPHGTGKETRVAVFAKGDKADEAKAAGADVVGAEDLAEIVQKGEIDFDRCIASPDMMAVVGRLGKILGPRGLMPNPKLGTVTANRWRRRREDNWNSVPKSRASSTPASARRASRRRPWRRTSRYSSAPSARPSPAAPRARI